MLKTKSILKTIWHSKHRWLGHVLRHEDILHDIVEGIITGKATQGRKRMELVHDIMEVREHVRNLVETAGDYRREITIRVFCSFLCLLWDFKK